MDGRALTKKPARQAWQARGALCAATIKGALWVADASSLWGLQAWKAEGTLLVRIDPRPVVVA